MRQYICIDIGGTTIKYGLAEANGDFLEKGAMPTDAAADGGAGILRKVIAIAGGFLSGRDAAGICVSTAGMVDPAKGQIVHAAEHLIPGYTGMRLKEEVERAFSLPCEVENDVNCAGLGEMWLGAGKGASSLFCMTVGTGIGGCVILDGRLARGFSNSAGEIGYMHIPGGQLQDLAATSRLVELLAEEKDASGVSGKQIFAWAKRGDPKAVRAIDDLVGHLAKGIANVCYVLNPEVVILGGGIMAQEAFLRPKVDAALRCSLIPSVYRHTRLEFAARQNDAGMLGALYHFRRKNEG